MARTSDVERRGASYQALSAQAAAGWELAEAVLRYDHDGGREPFRKVVALAHKVLGPVKKGEPCRS